MHVRQRRIVTASKDGSVAAAELGAGGGVRLLRRWGDHHAGVAKCARWRGQAAQVFASCGNDRRALTCKARFYSAPSSVAASSGSDWRDEGKGYCTRTFACACCSNLLGRSLACSHHHEVHEHSGVGPHKLADKCPAQPTACVNTRRCQMPRRRRL